MENDLKERNDLIRREDVLKILSKKDAPWSGFMNVQDLPAVDAVEVRHGRWIGYPECLRYVNAYSDDHIVCSECEECFSFLDNDVERFDYCPHCGARMDGEEEHNAAD